MFKCNECEGTYPDTQPDGTPFYHVCPPEVINHAKCDASGNVVEPETRKPRQVIRNENMQPGVFYVEGEPHVMKYNESAGYNLPIKIDAHAMVSEGKGREQVR